jgi:hypothetical protein
MKESHIPNLKCFPPTTDLSSFEAISIRVGLIAKKISAETQDTTDRSSQASSSASCRHSEAAVSPRGDG